ncbi:MAG: TonB-dependent receptor, partial [Puia sp.]|nr:TonB-dependent receptor [Puia sp.]
GTWDGGQPGKGPDLIQMVVIDGTHTFTPHLLLDGDVGFTRLRVGAQASDLALGDYGTKVLGIPGTNYNGQYLYGGIPAFTFVSYAGLGNTTASNPFLFRDNQYAGNLNLSYTRGQHGFRFGGEYIHAATNHFQPQQGSPRGTFNFNGSVASASGTSGNNFTSFAEFLLGDPQSISKGVQSTNPIALRWSSYAFYAQDTWQLGTKLTVNYGTRYEYFTIPVHDHNGPFEYLPQVPTTVTDSFGTHTVGTVFIGGTGNTPASAFISNGRGMFVPRVGIDYRTDNKTVIRTGYGISVDPQNLLNARNTYPAQIALSQSGANSYVPTTNFTTGIPSITIPNLSTGEVPLPQNISTYVFPLNFRRGYIESWNLAVERVLPASFVADVAYVGTHAVRQIVNLNIN